MVRAKSWLALGRTASKAAMPPKQETPTTFVPTAQWASTTKTSRMPRPTYWPSERAFHCMRTMSRFLTMQTKIYCSSFLIFLLSWASQPSYAQNRVHQLARDVYYWSGDLSKHEQTNVGFVVFRDYVL